jgi:hypothetical protein
LLGATTASGCPAGEHCSTYNPFDAMFPRSPMLGNECRAYCEDGRCAQRGPMPYACLPNNECYPGVFNVPCNSSEECIRGLSCESFDDPEIFGRIHSYKMCTMRCDVDADCQAHSFAADGICLNPALQDSPADAGVLSRAQAVAAGICVLP